MPAAIISNSGSSTNEREPITDQVLDAVDTFATEARHWGYQVTQVLAPPATGSVAYQLSKPDKPELGAYAFTVGRDAPTKPTEIVGEPKAPGSASLPALPTSFDYTDKPYSIRILTEALSLIADMLRGEALTPRWVWDSLRAKAAARIERVDVAERYAARQGHAALGWDMPGPALFAREQLASERTREAMNQAMNELAVEQARQVREDRLQGVQQALAGELMGLQIHTQDRDRILKSVVEKFQTVVALHGARLSEYKVTELDLFQTLWGGLKARLDALNQEYATSTQAYQAVAVAEASRVDAVFKKFAADWQHTQLVWQTQVEQAKNAFNVWSTEWNVLSQWRGHAASAYAALGGSAYSAANVSLGADSRIGHDYNNSVSTTYHYSMEG